MNYIDDGGIFTQGAEPASLRPLCTLADGDSYIETRRAGSREYQAGHILTTDSVSIGALFGAVPATVWLVWNGVFLRIQGFERNLSGQHRIDVDQSAQIGVAIIDGVEHSLRLVEPSPPQPTEQWFDTERARAIRDLVGDQQPPPLVLVPFRAWEVTD